MHMSKFESLPCDYLVLKHKTMKVCDFANDVNSIILKFLKWNYVKYINIFIA